MRASNSGLANPYGSNTVVASPDFIFPSSNTLLADFHLQPSSAAKNTGTHFYAPSSDKDGNIRLLTDSVDIGCYELQITTGILDLIKPQNFITIYPNPFTTQITLTGVNENGNIEIFDITGKRISGIKSQTEKIEINTEKLPSGLFFIHYTEGTKYITAKVVKL